MFRVHMEAVKHLLLVTCYSRFFSKPREDINQGVQHVWTLQEMFIKGLIQDDGTAVEDSTNLIWVF